MKNPLLRCFAEIVDETAVIQEKNRIVELLPSDKNRNTFGWHLPHHWFWEPIWKVNPELPARLVFAILVLP